MFPVPSSTAVLDHDVKHFGSNVSGRHILRISSKLSRQAIQNCELENAHKTFY